MDPIRIPLTGPSGKLHAEVTPDIARQIFALVLDEDMQRLCVELDKAKFVARLEALEKHYHHLKTGQTALPVTDSGPVPAPVDAGPAALALSTEEIAAIIAFELRHAGNEFACAAAIKARHTRPSPPEWSQYVPATGIGGHPENGAVTPPADDAIDADHVEWVVNDSGELGVKIGNQFFFMYKGHSLVYDSAKHDDGSQMRWRLIGKREFGECCHPYRMNGLSAQQYFGGIGAGGDWHDLPATVDARSP
jgi:hypothetical protein